MAGLTQPATDSPPAGVRPGVLQALDYGASLVTPGSRLDHHGADSRARVEPASARG